MVKCKDKMNSGEYDDDDEGDILPFQGHVLRGKDIQALQDATLAKDSTAPLFIHPYFSEVGIGGATDKDGIVFLCQLYATGFSVGFVDTT